LAIDMQEFDVAPLRVPFIVIAVLFVVTVQVVLVCVWRLVTMVRRGTVFSHGGRAKAVRFTTLAALCEVLDCQPGDLLRWEPDGQG
jgi:DUF2975 family protein/Cro/C1-type helix-turn-helix DNA-binding protein